MAPRSGWGSGPGSGSVSDSEAEARSGAPEPIDDPAGHRKRLTERLSGGGLQSCPDYELLEACLFRTQRRGDTKARAKALLARFGSLGGVLSASLQELCAIRGVGEAAALDLKLLHELAQRLGREPLAKRAVISSWSALLAYVRVALQHETREQFRILLLDVKNQLIADEIMNEGTINHAPVYPREVVRRALERAAASVILIHNHPSGDPTPSRADIEITRQIADAGRPLGVAVHDHLIVGRDGVTSLKALGLF